MNISELPYPDLIAELKTYGTSRAAIAKKLQRAGYSTDIDQSTLLKWEREENPGPKMRQAVERAITLLRGSVALEKRFGELERWSHYLTLLQITSSEAQLEPINVLPIAQAVQEAGMTTLTLNDLLKLITIAIQHRIELNTESIPTLLSLLKRE